jgi:hypothetical protein
MNIRLLLIVLGVAVLGHPSFTLAQLALGAGGNYGGILEADSSGDPDNSGILTVVLRDSGAATIKLFWQGQAYPIKARFGSNNQVLKSFAKKNDTAGTELSLFCDLNPDTRTINGFLSDPTATSGGNFSLSGEPPNTADLAQLPSGLRMAFIDPTAPIALPESGAAPAQINEDGFALVTVANTSRRSTRFVGSLPDATKYSAGSPARGAQYALRAGLYSQKARGSGGQLLGSGDVSGSSSALSEARDPRGLGGTAAQLVAALRWHKKKAGQINTTSFPNGLDQRVNLDTVRYNRDRDLTRVLLTGPSNATQGNARLRMTNGNLGSNAEAPGPNPVNVALNVTIFGAKVVGTVVDGVVMPDNRHRVKMSVNPLSAKFSGSFKHPDTGETMKFKGSFRSFVDVVPGEGRGNFLSLGPQVPRGTPRDPADAQSGSVRITVN